MQHDDYLEVSIKRHTTKRRTLDTYWNFREELSDNFEGYLPTVDYLEDDVEAIRRLHDLRDMVDDALEEMEYA